MIIDGSHEAIAALKEKKRLMEHYEPHDHIVPLLIFGGGLMKGVYGAGAALALEELGYRDVFSHVVGISSGAPVAAHFVAGSVRRGLPILTEECCTRRFSNPWRFWNQVNTTYFMDVIRHHKKKRVIASDVLKSPAQIYFGVSDYATGKPVVLRPQTDEEVFLMMHASLTMQNVSRHRTIIDGVHYADGGFTRPHILQQIIDTIPATHVIFVTNNDRVFGTISQFEKILNRTLFRLRLNGPQVTAINGRREERDKAIISLWSSGKPSAIIWGDGSVKSMERNVERLKATIESSRIWWYGLLSDS